MNSPTWSNLFVNFTSIYTTAQNSSAYSLDASGDIYFYDYTTGSWNWINGPTTNPIVSISASVDGSIAVLDNTGNAFLYAYGAWNNVNTSALNISVADADHYIITSASGAVTKYSFGSTATVVSNSGGPSKISTTANFSQIYGVDGSGAVYQRNGAVWATLSGKTLQQIDVSLSSAGSTQVCGVDASGNGWVYNGSTWATVTKPTGVTKFLSLEGGVGFIWATDSNGGVFKGSFNS